MKSSKHYLLLYDYVDDMLERRVSYRDRHLALAQEHVEKGQMLLAGAYAEPPHGGVLVFQTEDRSVVESFVSRDPYIENGLVTGWQIREWTVVLGSCLNANGDVG